MRARVGLLIGGLALAPAAHAVEGAPSKCLGLLRKDYLDGLFAAKPHLATFMGDHRFDEKLPDLSPDGIKLRLLELKAQRAAADDCRERDKGAKAADKLSLDERIDLDILEDGVDLELLYLNEIRDFTWDPRLHDSFPFYDPREIVAGRLSDIIHGDYAPEAARRKAVIGQLKALPRFLDQMKAVLKNPSKVYTEQAIKDNRGRIEFFQTEAKEFLDSRRDAARFAGKEGSLKSDSDGEKARVAAVAALESYQSFMEKELLPRSNGDWRLGAALYRKKFPLALQTRFTPAEVLPRAEAAFKSAREELYQVARELHRKLWPAEPAPAAHADRKILSQVISRVKAELAKEHPKAAELVSAHGQKLDGLRAFIAEHGLLTLPPAATLQVKETPLFKRGGGGAEYLAPGVLDRSGPFHATYYVEPVDTTWPADKIESYLRANNDYAVTLTAAHEAYPGHHTQFSYERKDLNPLRAVLWNGAFAEGWAVYAESLLPRLGFGGERNLGFRFESLKGHMVVATNALIDIKLQSGQMSDEEAVRFMVEEGFQEKAQAERKLLRAKLDSTQLAQYFLGFEEINELEREVRKKQGGRFDQRAFDEALIGHGSVAVKHLRRYLLGD
jgi:uncharacterized protein (DUF885 family)